MVFLVNSVSNKADAAIKVSISRMPGLFSRSPLCSPINERKLSRENVEVNSICACTLSIVGRLKLHFAKMLPNSVKVKNGEQTGEMPPSRSCSARLRQIRSS
jgi:hypothetical protein